MATVDGLAVDGSGTVLDFGSIGWPINPSDQRQLIVPEIKEESIINCTIKFDPPILSPLVNNIDEVEIVWNPTDRQLKRQRRRLRRNKRRSNNTRRKQSQRDYTRIKPFYLKEYMRIKAVEQDGDNVSLTMEVL